MILPGLGASPIWVGSRSGKPAHAENSSQVPRSCGPLHLIGYWSLKNILKLWNMEERNSKFASTTVTYRTPASPGISPQSSTAIVRGVAYLSTADSSWGNIQPALLFLAFITHGTPCLIIVYYKPNPVIECSMSLNKRELSQTSEFPVYSFCAWGTWTFGSEFSMDAQIRTDNCHTNFDPFVNALYARSG